MRQSIAFVAAGLMLIGLNTAASAQDDLEKGKTGAQIFASDCAICHKTPQVVLKGGSPGEGFLRQHYTPSREAAAKVAAYLSGIKAPARAERPTKPKSAAKPASAGEPKPAGEKPNGSTKAEPGDAAADEAKPSEKASDAKAGEAKAPETREQPDSKKE